MAKYGSGPERVEQMPKEVPRNRLTALYGKLTAMQRFASRNRVQYIVKS